MRDFDLAALSEALDARRPELGLTWREFAIQVTGRQSRRSDRRIVVTGWGSPDAQYLVPLLAHAARSAG
jgi:hypothetical protein